jgi:hypothetical protein
MNRFVSRRSVSAAALFVGCVAMAVSAGDTACPEDIDGNGVINGVDLGRLLNKWGTCGNGNGGTNTASLNWAISSRSDAQPSDGSSVQDSTGATVKIYDKNNNSQYWQDFAVNNLYLLKGPSTSTDKLRVTVTVDFSTIIGKDGPVNANLYLNGYGVDGSDTPALINSSYSHWYYGDSNAGPGSACTTDSTIPELDLFETGSSAEVVGGLPSVIQITSHAGTNGGGQAGAFIGIGNNSTYSTQSQNITSSEPTLSVAGTGNTYLGMNITLPFTMTYVISSTQIQLTATQGSVTSVVNYTPATGGVKDWTKYKYFSAVIGVNDGYIAGSYNGMAVSTVRASTFQFWKASGLLFELSTDGGATYSQCQQLDTYTSGYHYSTSDCPIESRPLTVATP